MIYKLSNNTVKPINESLTENTEQNFEKPFKLGDKLVAIKDIYYGNLNDLYFNNSDIAEYEKMGFIKDNSLIFPKGTEFTVSSYSGPSGWPELVVDKTGDDFDFAFNDSEFKSLFSVIDNNESKSTKESYETSSGRKITVYANYNNAKAKAKELGYIEAEYGESFGKEYSYCEWTKTGEPNVGDSIVAYYHFDENGKPKPLSKEDAEWIDQENELGGFEDFNTLKSKSTVESYYSYESARPNTREFLDLMDKYSLDSDEILRHLIGDYWSDDEVGEFLNDIKSEYDLDESLKNLDEELSDEAKSAEIILRNEFLNEPYTDSDFRKYALNYMQKIGISSDEQYKVINHVMSSDGDKMVDLFSDLK